MQAEAPLARRTIECWGTVITIDVPLLNGEPGEVDNRLDAALPRLDEVARHIDALYSTWRPDSLATALRTGTRTVESLDPQVPDEAEMLDLLAAVERARSISEGAFDPWRAPGGFDPSGYVKGWGAGRIADSAVNAGLRDVCVNAAGDIATRGVGRSGGAWRIGIEHPDDHRRLCTVVDSASHADPEGSTGAVSTSGYSWQRGHVTGRGENGCRQASVIGPDAGLADALATALLVDGRDGAEWFTRFTDSDITGYRPVSRWGAIIIDGDELVRLGGGIA